MTPINYTLDVQQPFQAAMQGYQAGAAIRNDQQQQQAMLEQQRQQQLAAQQQAAMNADLSAASRDPRLLPQVMVRYPQLAKELKHGWDAMTTEQQNSQLSHAGQVLAAIESGRPDIAINTLRERATALRNGGDEQGAKAAEDMARLAEIDPAHLSNATLYRIAPIPGGDKIIKAIGDMREQRQKAELHGPAVRKAGADATTAEANAAYAKPNAEAAARKTAADATTAETTAKFSERKALLDLEEKGWNIKALQNDIEYKRQANRIAAMNAATSREGNDLKRQELRLKIKEAETKLDSTIRDKVAAAESGAGAIDNMLNTIERIKKNPRLDDVLGGVEGRMPGMRDDSVDAIALIETLGSQAFLAQIPNIKGMGALSNAEGEKLQSALQNLSRKQSEEQFRANLDEASRLLKKGRVTLAKSSGVPLGKPDTPAAPGARPPLDSFIR